MSSYFKLVFYWVSVLVVSSILFYTIGDFIMTTQFTTEARNSRVDVYDVNDPAGGAAFFSDVPQRWIFTPRIPDEPGFYLNTSFRNGRKILLAALILYFLPAGALFVLCMKIIKFRYVLIQAALAGLFSFMIISLLIFQVNPMARGAYLFSYDFNLIAGGIFLAPFFLHLFPFYQKMLTPAA